jgi:hypothetical protein
VGAACQWPSRHAPHPDWLPGAALLSCRAIKAPRVRPADRPRSEAATPLLSGAPRRSPHRHPQCRARGVRLRCRDVLLLSACLKGVDAAAARMRAPLADLRDKVTASRVGASAALAALCAGLEQGAATTSARELLELLLDTSQRHQRRPRHPECAAPPSPSKPLRRRSTGAPQRALSSTAAPCSFDVEVLQQPLAIFLCTGVPSRRRLLPAALEHRHHGVPAPATFLAPAIHIAKHSRRRPYSRGECHRPSPPVPILLLPGEDTAHVLFLCRRSIYSPLLHYHEFLGIFSSTPACARAASRSGISFLFLLFPPPPY